MIHPEILKREEGNYNKIYLYIDVERNRCHAYNLSAYLITKLLGTEEFELKKENDMETVIYTLHLPLQLVVDQFDGNHTQVGEQFIKVTIDDLPRCIQWKLEFETLEVQRQENSVDAEKPFLFLFR